ncbi:MAG: M20 aminoacylase family protein [Pseudomonadota bacterium]
MPIRNSIADLAEDMKLWRRDIHKHPELAYEEHRTSDLVAEKLESWGIEVVRGLGGTGLVGLVRGQNDRDGGPMIGLRADLDALPMAELNSFEHRSVHEGKMHGCGHDGHTAMLLGAGRYLAENRNFNGQVALIFQPAEEGGAGAKAMIDDGLFERFPVNAVYGMHNMPGIPAGHIALREGPILAGSMSFELTVRGQGAHAAMPHLGRDTIVIASGLVGALQSISSRRVDPLENVVMSVTQFHAGSAVNVLPEEALLRGTVRCFSVETQQLLRQEMSSLVAGYCQAQGAEGTITFDVGYPAVFNWVEQTRFAAEVAEQALGEDAVNRSGKPLMGSEDFAYMLQEKPGCFVFIGNGSDSGPSACSLHNPYYDFNDDIMPAGVEYWVRLVEKSLS